MKKGFFKRAAAFATAVLMAAWVITVLPDGCLPQIGTVVSAEEAGGVAIDEVNFPDDIFRQYVLDECDIDHDGFLSDEEIGQVTKIMVANSGIQRLNGIEYLTSLENLLCASNRLTSLDVSRNTALLVLDCRKNNLISLDTSSNTALSELICSYNNLTSLDLSRNTALSELYCYNNNLTSLDISNNTLLKYLDCNFNQLTSLDVSKNTALIILDCDSNQLTSLDVGNNTALTDLHCDGNRYNIGETCEAYDLKNLPVGFDLTKVSNWQGATLESDVLIGIDGNGFISYDYDCGNNHTATVYLTYNSVDHTYDDGVITIEPTEQTEGEKTYTCTNCGATKTEPIAKLEHADCIAINEINFPDEIFRQYVSGSFDGNDDGFLSDEEISSAAIINVSGRRIQSLKGIEYFTALEILFCQDNQLTSLDVSKNTELYSLLCYNNQLISLDVSQNTALDNLLCDRNKLTSLDLSQNTALTFLQCNNNKLTSLNVSQNTSLEDLYCYSNSLTSLDVSNNTALSVLQCNGNKLISLDVSQNTKLEYLYCNDNSLTSLDVSQNTKLEYLYCHFNSLTSLDLSKNTALIQFDCDDNRFNIGETCGIYDPAKLPSGFDINKASDWQGAALTGDILTGIGSTANITYNYDCGNGKTAKFTLTYKKINHTYDEGVVTTEPTEETEGEITYTCTVCGATDTDVVAKLEHVHNKGTELMSDETGHWYTCSGCDEKLDFSTHTEDDGTVTVKPTETTEGEKVYKCTVCGYTTRTDVVAKLEHVHNKGTELMSDETGHWYTCSGCDEKLDFAAHTEDSGTVTVEPTETINGQKVYKCTVCGYTTRTETVEKLEHVHNQGNELMSNETGHWYACSGCDEKLDFATHIEDSGTVTVEPTETTNGQKVYKCTVCGYTTRTETVANLGHVHNQGTELLSNATGHWYACSDCDEKLDFAAHTEDDGTVTVEPTETTEGQKVYKCMICSYPTRTETVEKLEHVHNQGDELMSDATGHWYTCSGCDEKLDFATHTEDSGTVTVEPTINTEGQKVYKCTVCDYTIRTETIAKLGNGNDEPTVPSQPTNPTEPSQPSNPTEPSNPSQPSTPDNGGNSSNGNTSTAAPVGGTKTETLTVKIENKVTGKASKARAQKTGNSVSVKLGTENNGYYANVYTTDDDYICSAVIENGRAKFSVPEGIKIKIVIDTIAYGEDVSSGAGIYETDDNSQAPLGMIVIIIAVFGFTSITIVKRFGKNKR